MLNGILITLAGTLGLISMKLEDIRMNLLKKKELFKANIVFKFACGTGIACVLILFSLTIFG